MNISIEQGQLQDITRVLSSVPELHQQIDLEEAAANLSSDGQVLLAVAAEGGDIVGFKAGYDRFSDGSYYSWLGGVIPAYRGHGVAQSLLDAQEQWAVVRGYTRIFVKTRNKYVGMRILLARNGYQVCGFAGGQVEDGLGEGRLMHVKALLS